VKLTPLHFQILFWSFKGLQGGEFQPSSQTARDYAIQLSDRDLLSKNDCGSNTYELTERGRAFIAMLCETPFPESKSVTVWVDPRNDEVIKS
jgi:hypothetical protein